MSAEGRRVFPGVQPGALAVALDMGGTWVRGAVADTAGRFLWRDRVPTAAQDEASLVIGRARDLLDRALAQTRGRPVAGVGMGVAGPVDPETGILYAPPNIPSLDGVSFKALWERDLGIPFLVGNDATLAALGEYYYGSGFGSRTLVYVTVSTGIGGGVVVDGRPLMGAHGMAGELGHMTVDAGGPQCKCGNRGCLEELASGTAIASRAGVMAAQGTAPVLMEMAAGEPARITAQMVFDAARRGDRASRGVLDEAARALGAGLVNIMHIFDPDIIVIGGGVSRNWDTLRPGVEEYVRANAMSHIQKLGVRVVVSNLGDEIGMLGAAAMVFQGVAQGVGPGE